MIAFQENCSAQDLFVCFSNGSNYVRITLGLNGQEEEKEE